MTDSLSRQPATPAIEAVLTAPQPVAGAPLHLGGLSPLFPPATVADAGRLRLGGLSPLFAPAAVADAGGLRLGGLSPLFGRG